MAIVVRCAKVPTLALCAVLAPALATGGIGASSSSPPPAHYAIGRCPHLAYEHVSSLVTEVGPRLAG